jgi:hypothetical protein
MAMFGLLDQPHQLWPRALIRSHPWTPSADTTFPRRTQSTPVRATDRTGRGYSGYAGAVRQKQVLIQAQLPSRSENRPRMLGLDQLGGKEFLPGTEGAEAWSFFLLMRLHAQ